MGTIRTAVARIATALVVAAVAITPCAAIEFDELDKPPEGAHKGQMFLGVVISVGAPSGELVDAETAFVDGSTYTFENEVTKQLKVSHLFFGVGASFEYMPIDHVGAKTRAMQTIVVQRTEFGTDYENWRENLYTCGAIYAGPAFHLTTRRSWDVTLAALAGYGWGEYAATPVAKKLIENYTGENKKTASSFTYLVELAFCAYFSGGLYFSIGGEFISYAVDFGKPFELVNPQTQKKYYEGKSAGAITSVNCVLSIGYAFSN